MSFWEVFLEVLNWKMETPQPYGWFHLLCFGLSIAAAIALCALYRTGKLRNVRSVVLTVAVIVAVLEVYKQVVYSLEFVDGRMEFDYPWYIFPWQFCSMPMYVGLLAGLTKGRVHRACCAFLATYAVFAGLCVMLYPVTIFTERVGICVQTMVCHGSMITVGIFLLYTGYVKSEHRTILRALPVFLLAVAAAMVMNELAHATGLLERETFNMFFIRVLCQ